MSVADLLKTANWCVPPDYYSIYVWLTAQHHDKDAKHFLIVCVWSNIAKSDWDEPGKREVEGSAVASLQVDKKSLPQQTKREIYFSVSFLF